MYVTLANGQTSHDHHQHDDIHETARTTCESKACAQGTRAARGFSISTPAARSLWSQRVMVRRSRG